MTGVQLQAKLDRTSGYCTPCASIRALARDFGIVTGPPATGAPARRAEGVAGISCLIANEGKSVVSRVQLVMRKAGNPRLRPFSQRAKIATKRALFLDLRDGRGVARSEAGRAAQKQCAGRTDTRLASKAGGRARGES